MVIWEVVDGTGKCHLYFTQTQKNTLSSQQLMKLRDFLEFNEKEYTQTYGMVLRGKLIAQSAYIKTLERLHTSNLTAYLKFLEQKREVIPQSSTMQETLVLKQ